MDAVKYGAAVLYRARASTDSGDVHLESRHEDAVRIAVQVFNERSALIVQRDALVAACRAARSSLSGFVHLDDLGDVQDAIKKCKTALALVKSDQKSDDATA